MKKMAAPTNLLSRKLVLSLFAYLLAKYLVRARMYKVCWLSPNPSNVQQGVKSSA